tara:strand:- start:6375 stop:6692 length:318 start_codon:yes stop_codon:yes gene_type:complete
MIGSLLHYNCASSQALGIVTAHFHYKGLGGRGFSGGDVLVAVEWVKKDKIMPQEASIIYNWSPTGDIHGSYKEEEHWPENSNAKTWYNFKYFKVLSHPDNKKINI